MTTIKKNQFIWHTLYNKKLNVVILLTKWCKIIFCFLVYLSRSKQLTKHNKDCLN